MLLIFRHGAQQPLEAIQLSLLLWTCARCGYANAAVLAQLSQLVLDELAKPQLPQRVLVRLVPTWTRLHASLV